jgi:hypothetical protein
MIFFNMFTLLNSCNINLKNSSGYYYRQTLNFKESKGGWGSLYSKKAHPGIKSFPVILKMNGENRFRYLNTGDKITNIYEEDG